MWPQDPRSKIQDLAGEGKGGGGGGGGGGALPDKQNMAKYTKIQNPESRIQNACSGKSISLDEQLHLK